MIAVQALISQQSKLETKELVCKSPRGSSSQMVLYGDLESFSEGKEDVTQNLQRMQWRVVELEKVCRDMKGQMSRVRHKVLTVPGHSRSTLPRLC